MEDKILALREKHFSHLLRDFAHLNNGSFGTAPMSVLAVQNAKRGRWYSQPVVFLYDLEDGIWNGIKKAVEILGELVNCPSPYHEHLALMENLTSAANTVVKAVAWKFMSGEYQKGDSVIIFDSTYGAVANCVKHYLGGVGANIIRKANVFPVFETPDNSASKQLVQTVKDALTSSSTPIRLVILDHISSMPSMLHPIKEMVAVCREHNVSNIFVDGAHALGNVPIDVQDIDADFYASNCHKWCFTPSTGSFLYSKSSTIPLKADATKASQSEGCLELHHPIVGWAYNNGLFFECYTGTRDYSAYLSIDAAVEFGHSIVSELFPERQFAAKGDGFRALMEYNSRSAADYAQKLAAAWKSIVATPNSLISSMAMVALPADLCLKSRTDASLLRTILRLKYRIDVPVMGFTPSEGVPYSGFVRISHQIYNLEAEYEKLKHSILEITSTAKTAENLQAAFPDYKPLDDTRVAELLF